MANEAWLLCPLFCLASALIMGIAASSWMLYAKKEDRWKNGLQEIFQESELQVADFIIESWESSPFIDLMITDQYKCPN